MKITRRKALAGSAASAAALATGVFRPAIAQSEPIRIGYMPALTGPSSSTGIGINRGTEFRVGVEEGRTVVPVFEGEGELSYADTPQAKRVVA